MNTIFVSFLGIGSLLFCMPQILHAAGCEQTEDFFRANREFDVAKCISRKLDECSKRYPLHLAECFEGHVCSAVQAAQDDWNACRGAAENTCKKDAATAKKRIGGRIPLIPTSSFPNEINAALKKPEYANSLVSDISLDFFEFVNRISNDARYELTEVPGPWAHDMKLVIPYRITTVPVRSFGSAIAQSPMDIATGKTLILDPRKDYFLESMVGKELGGAIGLMFDIGYELNEVRESEELYHLGEQERRRRAAEAARQSLLWDLAKQINPENRGKADSKLHDLYDKGRMVWEHNQSVLVKVGRVGSHPTIGCP